ncbi:MAG: hypothetical protein AAF675_09620 [Pseudomonadota bacterium]
MSVSSGRLPSSIALVLGMHRSGSSAVTRVLSYLGYALPKTLIPGNLSNRRGHWESRPIARLNDDYLSAADLVWSDWVSGLLPRMRSAVMRDYEADIRAHVIDEFPGRQPAVLKDPRICRLMPRYRGALERSGPLHAVIPVRNPLEVISSLMQRNAMSEANAGLIWLRYHLDAVEGSEGLPRAFLAYEKLLDAPEETLAKVEATLDIAYPVPLHQALDDIRRHLDPALRSHRRSVEEVIEHNLTRGWISDTYSALRLLTEDPASKRPLETLARIRREVVAAEPMLSHIIGGYDRRCTSLERRVAALTAATELRAEQVRLLRSNLREGAVAAPSQTATPSPTQSPGAAGQAPERAPEPAPEPAPEQAKQA